jgi:superfamily II DNA/RNA helicase
MFKKSFSGRGNAPRSNFGRKSFGAKPNFRRGFSGGNRRVQTGGRIDPTKFINKVTVVEKQEQFVPEHNFADFLIDQKLKATILNKGYQNPTPIQDKTIPLILQGQDVVGIANTGTGKTAAFLVPLINKVLANRREQVLIIVPTRELAQQIEVELREFTRGMQIFSVCAVGGAPIGKQLRDLRYEYNFIIGTPGRIKDLLERKAFNLNYFKSVVLDEADRMLDMGLDLVFFLLNHLQKL